MWYAIIIIAFLVSVSYLCWWTGKRMFGDPRDDR